MGRNAMVFGHVEETEEDRELPGEFEVTEDRTSEALPGCLGLCAPARPGDEQRMELLRSDADDIWLDIRALEIYLQVSKSTAYKLIKSGLVPSVRLGKLIRINKRKLDALLAEGQLGQREADE